MGGGRGRGNTQKCLYHSIPRSAIFLLRFPYRIVRVCLQNQISQFKKISVCHIINFILFYFSLSYLKCLGTRRKPGMDRNQDADGIKVQNLCVYSTLQQIWPGYTPRRRAPQGATVAHVWDQNFSISEPISMILGVFESRDPVLSNAPKIDKIG